MNFQEMLNAQEELKPRSEKLPIGDFYRTQIDSKYHFVVKLKPSLTDSIAFCDALKKDEQWSLHQRTRQHNHQCGGLHSRPGCGDRHRLR